MHERSRERKTQVQERVRIDGSRIGWAYNNKEVTRRSDKLTRD